MNYKKLFSVFALLALFSFIGCSQTTGKVKPGWISGKSPKFPVAFFIVGVGEGSTRSAAEDAARAQVAKQLSVKISAEEKYEVSEASSGNKTKQKSEALATVSSSTSELLEGLRIEQVYEDTEKFYALAVLDRDEAAAKIDSRIKKAEAVVEAGVLAGEIGDDFKKLTDVLKGVGASRDREKLAVRRKAILPDEPLKDGEWSAQKTALKAALEKVSAFVSIKGAQGAEEIQAAMTEVVTGMGFKTGQKENAAMTITGMMDMQPVDRDDPEWKYLKGRIKITVSDKNGDTRGETFITRQGAGLNENQAYHKTLEGLKKELARDFSGFLLRALGGK